MHRRPVFIKAAKMGPEMVNNAREIKIRSEIKAGEFLKTMEKQNGRPSSKRLQGVTLLSEMGIQRIQSHRWQKKPPLHYTLLFLCGGPTKAL